MRNLPVNISVMTDLVSLIQQMILTRFKNLQTGDNTVKYHEWNNIWIPDIVIWNSKEQAHTAHRFTF